MKVEKCSYLDNKITAYRRIQDDREKLEVT
jgi:hypothetical protein